MKKITSSFIIICLAFSSIAQQTANTTTTGEKPSSSSSNPMIKKGFILNLGFGFPSYSDAVTVSASSTSTLRSNESLGLQISLEIGNQWYFWKNEKMGIGLRANWLTLGYSSYTTDYPNFKYNNTLIEWRPLKLAPQFTYALSDKMALDFSLEFSAAFLIGGGNLENKPGYSYNGNGGTFGAGYYITPGAKFRYKKLAVGFDLGLGSGGLAKAEVATNAGTTSSANSGEVELKVGTVSLLSPKLYIGFKF
ncbi:MAG: hypothetical protein NW207_06580 [Cytophagales bacterium]|nr:hypothetical protein [Cytophagales bacterium]